MYNKIEEEEEECVLRKYYTYLYLNFIGVSLSKSMQVLHEGHIIWDDIMPHLLSLVRS